MLTIIILSTSPLYHLQLQSAVQTLFNAHNAAVKEASIPSPLYVGRKEQRERPMSYPKLHNKTVTEPGLELWRS